MFKPTLERGVRYVAPACETVKTVGDDVLCTSVNDWEYDDDPFND